MISTFIITLRETFEASLIVGVIYLYLLKSNGNKYLKQFYYGIILALLVGIFSAVLLYIFKIELKGTNEQIFEGSLMLISTILITWLIIWIGKNKSVSDSLQKNIDNSIANQTVAGIFFLSFFSVVREVLEIVLFLFSSANSSGGISALGGAFGALLAITIAIVFFRSSTKFKLKYFFNITGIILAFFAGTLLVSSFGEFSEALGSELGGLLYFKIIIFIVYIALVSILYFKFHKNHIKTIN
jgi:high-affinity iron transporter